MSDTPPLAPPGAAPPADVSPAEPATAPPVDDRPVNGEDEAVKEAVKGMLASIRHDPAGDLWSASTIAVAMRAIDEVQAFVRARAIERRKLVSEETKQLSLLLDHGPKAKVTRNTRAADEEAVLACLASPDAGVSNPERTVQQIAKSSSLGARARPALDRLRKKNLVGCRGRGQGAVWFLAQVQGAEK